MQTDSVERAIRPRSGITKGGAYTRLNAVMRDLLRAFQNDEDALQRWMHQPNKALDDRTPEDLLREGRVDVLERVRDAVKTLQFG